MFKPIDLNIIITPPGTCTRAFCRYRFDTIPSRPQTHGSESYKTTQGYTLAAMRGSRD